MLGNSILSSDTRGGACVRALERAYPPADLYAINPNIPGPQYSLPKMLWVREHERELYDRADHFLLWGDVVGFMLGAEPYATLSLANRDAALRRSKGGLVRRVAGLERH